MTIIRVAVFLPLRKIFDYLPPPLSEDVLLCPGMRVLVPFGRRNLVGLIIEVVATTIVADDKLKPALEILDSDAPTVPIVLLTFIQWISDYYQYAIGEVIANVLPLKLQQPATKQRKRKLAEVNNTEVFEPEQPIQLNSWQQSAVTAVLAATAYQTFLLHGVTGSGKTEVYLQVIAEVIKAGKQALVLVPEINLTPQMLQRFRARFAVNIAAMHSRLSDNERMAVWLQARDGKVDIIIGTRSAVFIPLKFPGVIILDEEHDLSFKQQTGLRYAARDLAVVRAKLDNIPIILGSATPSLESFYNVQRKRFIELCLPERAGDAVHPQLHFIDMRSQEVKSGLSTRLCQAIAQHLARGEQILMFLNRRGYAPVLLCHQCGWVAECACCDARLTMHHKLHQLQCHHCGKIQQIPKNCPKCQATELIPVGLGTERLEVTLAELFPQAKIMRVDRDTTSKKDAMQQILQQIHDQECQILIGTQMLSKGHHFPNVTMAVILNIDNSLFSSDFRAGEYLAQLIVQVSGRAGRADKPGVVYLQTYNPAHPLLMRLAASGYTGCVQEMLTERQVAQLPPFTYLALMRAESKNQAMALNFLIKIRQKIRTLAGESVLCLGPVPALMERKADYYRTQLLLQSASRKKIHILLQQLLPWIETMRIGNRIKWYIDIDPVDIC